MISSRTWVATIAPFHDSSIGTPAWRERLDTRCISRVSLPTADWTHQPFDLLQHLPSLSSLHSTSSETTTFWEPRLTTLNGFNTIQRITMSTSVYKLVHGTSISVHAQYVVT